MGFQKISHQRLLITIMLTLCLLMAVSFNNGALAATPGKATLISPMGTTWDDKPTYVWSAVSDSTWYYLWVNDSTGNPVEKWYTSAEAGCEGGTGLCSITPDIGLALGSCQWWIQTWNDDGFGEWSPSESGGLPFTVEEGFSATSIQGVYAFTGMEQGGAPAPQNDSVVQEAAMGIMSADGNGNIIGKISWNMYDFLDQVPSSDRLILHRFPFTGTYALENDGFGTMSGYLDLDIDGTVDVEISGKLVVTKTKDNMTSEFWFIGDEPMVGGSIVIIHFFRREQ